MTEASEAEKVENMKGLISIIRGYHLAMSRLDYNALAKEIFQDKPTPGSAMSYFFGDNSGFFADTGRIAQLIGLGNSSTGFGENALLYRFSAEGWDQPLPPGLVKVQ